MKDEQLKEVIWFELGAATAVYLASTIGFLIISGYSTWSTFSTVSVQIDLLSFGLSILRTQFQLLLSYLACAAELAATMILMLSPACERLALLKRQKRWLIYFGFNALIVFFFSVRFACLRPGLAEDFILRSHLSAIGSPLLSLITLRLSLEIWDCLGWSILALSFCLPRLIHLIKYSIKTKKNQFLNLFSVLNLDSKTVAALVLIIFSHANFGFIQSIQGSSPQETKSDTALGSNLKRPNILILGVDSLRPDHLSFGGYSRQTSPEIDQFLSSSLFFNRMYTSIARTAPSWTSILTGTYPTVHGVRTIFPSASSRNLALPNLVNILRKNNYQTSVISDYAGEIFDVIDFGFDRLKVPPAFSLQSSVARELAYAHPLTFILFDGLWLKRFLPVAKFLPIYSDPVLLAGETVDELEALRKSNRPFFLMSFFSAAHLPYTVAYPYYRKYGDPNYIGPSRYAYSIREFNQLKNDQYLSQETQEKRQVTDLYDEAILSVDASMGKIFQYLKSTGLDQNTIVVLLSDHGETLFSDNKTIGHGSLFVEDESDIRMTFGMKIPPQLSKAKPQKVSEITRSIDIAPSILDLIQIPATETMQGISFFSHLNQNTGNLEIQSRDAFIETEIAMNSAKEFSSNGALTYPPLEELIEPEWESGYFSVKDHYDFLLRRAKWRMLVSEKGKAVYIPKKDRAEWALSGLKNESDSEELKTKLFKHILEEPATFLSSGDLVDYEK